MLKKMTAAKSLITFGMFTAMAFPAFAGNLSEAVITKVQQQHQQEMQTGNFQAIKISQRTAVANQKAMAILASNQSVSSSSSKSADSSSSSSLSTATTGSPVASSGGSASNTLVSTPMTHAVSASLEIASNSTAQKQIVIPPAKAPVKAPVAPAKK